MSYINVTEGKIELKVPDPDEYKLDSSMPVFYNPVMRKNRDISILVLRNLQRKTKQPLRVLDLLAASGARGLRIKAEVPNTEVTLNDKNPIAARYIRLNAKKSKLKVDIKHKSANALLAELKPYDYIDVDPFGTPVPFLDAAIKRLSPHAVLAVTATDTSALCGTYPKAGLRKYSSKPLRNEFMHESGLRILIKKIQEVAAQYDVALEPIFSHSSEHYMRVYLQKSTGAGAANKVLAQHGYVLYCPACLYRKTAKYLLNEPEKCSCKHKFEVIGPMWLGMLWDRNLVRRMIKDCMNLCGTEQSRRGRSRQIANRQGPSKEEEIAFSTHVLTKQVFRESLIHEVGFYDIHKLAKKLKLSRVPKMYDFFEKLRKSGFKVERTHIKQTGFKTNAKLIDIKSGFT